MFFNNLQIEFLKMKRSLLPVIVLGLFCIGPIFAIIIMAALQDPIMLQRLATMGSKVNLEVLKPDWPSFLSIILQVVAVGAGVVSGFIAAFIYGRESAEGVLNTIFIENGPSSRFFFTKWVLSGLYVFAFGIIIFMISILAGIVVLPVPIDWQQLFVIFGKCMFTLLLHSLLIPTTGLVSLVARGYLPGIGFVVITMILSQILASLGVGTLFPWALPALAIGLGGPLQLPSLYSYIILGLVVVISCVWLVIWVKKADHH